MKKRWTAALMALILAATLLPVTAQAAQVDRSAGSRLTGADRAVYDALRVEVGKIASGDRTSTAIRIPNQSSLSWSWSELGASGSNRYAVLEKVKEKFLQTLHMERVYTALIADCPYEMYWKGTQYTYSCEYVLAGNQGYVQNLTLSIQPSQDYAGRAEYSLDPAKMAGAREAAANAKEIVNRYRDLPDYEKLNAYRQEICRLVSFESSAAVDGYPYGDPWQLVSVFDGDPSTNVVCEGYAKAFKYLCDLSDFQEDVTCYLVTGELDGGSHMWNVVRMGDGRNYLVDVTNCDSGTVGADDKLFLAGVSTSNGGQTCTISVDGSFLTYSYRVEERDLYTDGYLSLSQEDYAPPAAATPPQDTVPPESTSSTTPFTDVNSSDYFADYVAWAVAQGIAKGTTPTTFSPGQDCTQVQILTFLWRAAGEPASGAQLPVDIAGRNLDYAEGALRWAAEKGMIDAAFDLDAKCTRASAVTYIWQAFNCPGAVAAGFEDVAADADYAGAVAWAVLKGITLGRTETTFDPDAVCNRSEIAAFLYRAYH